MMQTTHPALEPNLQDTLFDILDQMTTGNIPAGDDPDSVRLIGAVRARYPRDEEVQRLCAWLENQSGALGELVDQMIGSLVREAAAPRQASHAA
jgi:hypothetical protein